MAFSPASISGLQLWLEADAGVLNASDAPAAHGESVKTWQDQSGNGNHAVQATVANQPTYITTSNGGHYNGTVAALRCFSGTAKVINSSIDLSAASAWTVLLAAKITVNGGSQRVLAGVNNNWLLGWWQSAVDQAYYAAAVRLTGSPAADYNARIYCGVGQGTNAWLFGDGSQITVATGVAQAGPNGLSIGGGSEPSDCDVVAVLAYSRAITSGAAFVNLHKYLNRKYGIYSGSTSLRGPLDRGLVS